MNLIDPELAETFESWQNDGDYARVKIEDGKNKLYALTKKGFNHCQELIESIYNTKFSQTTSKNDDMNKIIYNQRIFFHLMSMLSVERFRPL